MVQYFCFTSSTLPGDACSANCNSLYDIHLLVFQDTLMWSLVQKSYCERMMLANTELKVGSWNVAGLRGKSGKGKMANIRNHRELFDIFALQETHLPLQANQSLLMNSDRFFQWRFDREPVKGNQVGGGILVYFHEKLLQEQLAGVRQLPDLPPSVIKHDRNHGRNRKAGLQYMHFHIENPVQFHLVVIYNSTGCREDLVIFFQYFLQDLQLRNVMFIGDLNVNHRINEVFQTMLIDIDNSLQFHIEGDTCYKDANDPNQTDHIISCFDQAPVPSLYILENFILAGKCPSFDHYLIGCILVQKPGNTQWQIPRIVQPIWNRKITEKQCKTEEQGQTKHSIKDWVEERIEKGPCVLVTYIKLLELMNIKSLSTNSVKVYKASKEPETVICVGQVEKFFQLLPLVHEMEKTFQSLSTAELGIVSQRCSLMHVKGSKEASDVLGVVWNQTSRCLTENFELCAPRYYTCTKSSNECCQVFLNEVDLLNHDRSVHQRTIHKCGKSCQQQFQTKLLLELHRQAIHGTKIPKCQAPGCPVAPGKENREAHALIVHLRYVCDDKKCGGLKFKHKIKRHRCTECKNSSAVYHSQPQLEQHMKMKTHSETLPAEEFSCLKCNESCNTKEEFRSHLESCYGRKPFECNECEGKYMLESWYIKHRKRCTGNKPNFACDLCGKEYNKESSYNTHISWCGGEKPYRCKNCGKGYIYKGCLNTHESSCGGEKPYRCKKCGKGYIYEGCLNTHESWCGGPKPYRCATCNQEFVQETRYQTHIKKLKCFRKIPKNSHKF